MLPLKGYGQIPVNADPLSTLYLEAEYTISKLGPLPSHILKADRLIIFLKDQNIFSDDSTNRDPSLVFSSEKTAEERKLIQIQFNIFLEQYPRLEQIHSTKLGLLKEYRRIMGRIAFYFGYSLETESSSNASTKTDKFPDMAVESEARIWYTIATNLGDPIAAYVLANKLRFGLEGFKSSDGAIALFDYSGKTFINRNEFGSALRSIEAIRRTKADSKKAVSLGAMLSAGLEKASLEVTTGPRGKYKVVETKEGRPLKISLEAAVPDIDAQTSFKIETSPNQSEGSVSLQNDKVTFTPQAGFVGITSFTFKVTEQKGTRSITGPETPVIIKVKQGEIEPKLEIPPNPIVITQGHSAVVELKAIRTDNSVLPKNIDIRFRKTPKPVIVDGLNVTITNTGYAIVRTSGDLAPGKYAFGITATVNNGPISAPGIFIIEVLGVESNEPIGNFVDFIDVVINENQEIELSTRNIAAAENYTAATSPQKGIVTLVDNKAQFVAGKTPGLDYFSYTFNYKATNSEGAEETKTSKPAFVLLNIKPTGNEKPVVEGQSIKTLSGNPVLVHLVGTHPFGEVQSYIISNNASNSFIEGRYLVYNPQPGFIGKDVIEIKGIYKGQSSIPVNIEINVKPLPQAIITESPETTTASSSSTTSNQSSTNDISLNPFKTDDSLFTVYNKRRQADSFWLAYNPVNTIKFSRSPAGDSKELEGMLKRIGENQSFDSYTVGFDFTDWFSFALTRIFEQKLESVEEDSININGTNRRFTKVEYQQYMYTFYYYPYSWFYFGYGFLEGIFQAQIETLDSSNQVTSTDSKDLRINENYLTIGFNYDSSSRWLFRSGDPLDYGKEGIGWIIGASITTPAIQGRTSPIDEIFTVGIGLRFY